MSAAVRSPERSPATPTERPHTAANQRRVDEAFRLLGALAVRVVTDPNPSSYMVDLASQDGNLQAAWSRGGPAEMPVAGPSTVEPIDPATIAAGAYGPVNAQRYTELQRALSALLVELTRPGCTGSATLRFRGVAGELSDDVRGESHRQWRF
jgi:hypothetical protein